MELNDEDRREKVYDFARDEENIVEIMYIFSPR